MSIFSDTSILSTSDVNFLIDLLPIPQPSTPDIYIINDWKSVTSFTNHKVNLFEQYSRLRAIVNRGIFSTYNYNYNKIFVYLFNLPYQDPIEIKLHGAFCIFHEIRHHHQYINYKNQFLSEISRPYSYSHLWVEKDANNFALKWLRRNRCIINERFHLHHLTWDIRVNQNNRLRIITNQIDIPQKNDILV